METSGDLGGGLYFDLDLMCNSRELDCAGSMESDWHPVLGICLRGRRDYFLAMFVCCKVVSLM